MVSSEATFSLATQNRAQKCHILYAKLVPRRLFFPTPPPPPQEKGSCGVGSAVANRSLAELVIPKAELDSALVAKSSVAHSGDAIDSIMDGSRLGSSLFDDAKVICSAASFAKLIEANLDDLMQHPITEEHHTTILAKMSELAEASAGGGYLELRRRCTMGYQTLGGRRPRQRGAAKTHGKLEESRDWRSGGLDFFLWWRRMSSTSLRLQLRSQSRYCRIWRGRARLVSEVIEHELYTSFLATFSRHWQRQLQLEFADALLTGPDHGDQDLQVGYSRISGQAGECSRHSDPRACPMQAASLVRFTRGSASS